LAVLAVPSPAPRLGRLRGLFEQQADPAMARMTEGVVAQLRERGAAVLEVGLPPAFCEVIPRHRTIMAVEGAAYHQTRLQRHPEDYDPKIRGLLEEGLNTPAPEYARCKEHQQHLSRAMNDRFHGVDVLLTPATTSPAPDTTTTGDPAFNSPWSYTGHPTISIPAAWTADGLPLAIQLVGRPLQEDKLFAAAAWCERVLAFEARSVT
jgi:aspartyl-tRNA(Asn)/glutamyl-tRNA(Gln) amidotransferase subunit A